MLRPWVNSEKVNSLTAHSERFFTRLIMVVDDYGCFYGSEKILKASLFPLLLDAVRDADISRWLAECQKAGLIVIYETEGKKYLQILDFRQRLDRAKRKFPEPIDDVAKHPLTIVNDFPPEQKGSRKEEKRDDARAPAPDLSNSNLFRKPVIPTKNQVWEAISAAGGTKEMAKSFYEKHEGTGWYTDSGTPITNYVAFANRFVDTWKRNEKKPDGENNQPNQTLQKLI